MRLHRAPFMAAGGPGAEQFITSIAMRGCGKKCGTGMQDTVLNDHGFTFHAKGASAPLVLTFCLDVECEEKRQNGWGVFRPPKILIG